MAFRADRSLVPSGRLFPDATMLRRDLERYATIVVDPGAAGHAVLNLA